MQLKKPGEAWEQGYGEPAVGSEEGYRTSQDSVLEQQTLEHPEERETSVRIMLPFN